MSAPPRLADAPDATAVPLPSGRIVVVEAGDGERLQVLSPDGQVELRVQLTAAGPVLRLSAARLELAADVLSLSGRRVEIEAREQATLQSAGEVVVTAPLIRLN